MSPRRLVAEALGTFILVFAGTTAIVVDGITGGGVTHVGIALTFGLIVLAMVYAIGNVSGAHMNPAVTLAFCAAGRFDRRHIAPYVVSQCAGAFLASACVLSLFPGHPTLGATLPSGAAAQSFVLEVILSFILMFVILSVSTGAKEKGLLAGVAIGSVIALEALLGGPISGASMNPARSLAPAILAGRIEHLWVYLGAPVVGTLAGVLACRCVQSRECCRSMPEEGA